MGKLVDRIKNALEREVVSLNRTPVAESEFQRHYLDAVTRSTLSTLGRLKVDMAENHVREQVEAAIKGEPEICRIPFKQFQEMRTNYGILCSVFQQERQADLWEHVRVLVFALAKGIGIATIVILSGYVAHGLGISIPLMRPY